MMGSNSLWDERGDLRPEKVRHVLEASKLGHSRASNQAQVSRPLAGC